MGVNVHANCIAVSDISRNTSIRGLLHSNNLYQTVFTERPESGNQLLTESKPVSVKRFLIDEKASVTKITSLCVFNGL